MTQEQLQQLLRAVEQAMGEPMATPRDFEALSQRLDKRLGERLSVSTLKRLWGYVNNGFTPSRHTVDVLARFLGYAGWQQFTERATAGVAPSDPVMGESLNVEEHLGVGDRLRLTWAPDRECVIRYCGRTEWIVERSRNTRLQPGDVFKCGLFIAGEPLYLDDLRQLNRPATAYVCGRTAGVRFELLDGNP